MEAAEYEVGTCGFALFLSQFIRHLSLAAHDVFHLNSSVIGTEADLCESTWTQHRHKSPATEIHTKQRFNPTIKQELPLALNCTQGAALSLAVARHTTVLWIRQTSPPITARLLNHQASGCLQMAEKSLQLFWLIGTRPTWEIGNLGSELVWVCPTAMS